MQIYIISAKFCGLKCALIAQINVNSQSELLTKFFVAILAFFSVYGDKKKHCKGCYKMFIYHCKISKCDCFANFLS